MGLVRSAPCAVTIMIRHITTDTPLLSAIAPRTPEWYAERAKRLTASDFAASVGINPYMSRQALWRTKMGLEPKFEGNEATAYGEANEANAIAGYEFVTGNTVVSCGLVVHPDHSWLGASPDGFVAAGSGCIESKCRFNGTLFESVPDYYMPQVQGVMECADKEWCDFFSWIPGKVKIFRVYRSAEYWAWMFPLLETFWQQVQKGTETPRARRPTFSGKVEVEEVT